jgi:hypothetical protein
MIATALAEPFVSSLINMAHLACDFLIFFVLLTGLLSTSAGKTSAEQTRSEEADAVGIMSIFVVSYAAVILTALVCIMWLETGSMFHKGGRRQATWDRYVESGPGAAAMSLSKKLSTFAAKRLSSMTAFSTVAPEAATSCAENAVVQVSTAAAAGTSASRDLRDVSTLNQMRTHLKGLSLAADAMLADVDDGDNLKVQLEKLRSSCAQVGDALGQ